VGDGSASPAEDTRNDARYLSVMRRPATDEPSDLSDDDLPTDPDAGFDLDDDELASLDADFPLGDGVADGTAEVWCPYCGEPNEIAVDPGSGEQQEYVEDCQVCCQPWQVIVHYGPDGEAEVTVTTLDEG
jgi:hypothetical protein